MRRCSYRRMTKPSKKYYNIEDDLRDYPDCWLYVVYSKRGPGKTYSFLNMVTRDNIEFLYMKRTQIDIKLLCKEKYNPFKPINRDRGTNYRCVLEDPDEGIAKIVDGNNGDETIGACGAMSAVHKYKGFDLSEVEYICFDEFIPQLSERVNRKEGELLLDLYMTVNRDREERGREPLKLILFANATELYCPITDTLQLVDVLAELNASGEEFRYLKDREIFIRHVLYSPSANENTRIFKGMAGTQWADMAFGGTFAYNDFTKVKKVPMKGMVCYLEVIYQRKSYYIYQHRDNGLYYMCRSKGKVDETYDMEIESDQRRFWQSWGILLRQEVTDGNMMFSDYSAYNLIYNFTKIYKF